MNYDALLDIDGHGRPIYGDSPFKAVNEIVFVGDGATVAVPLFHTTGSVMVTRLWGIVTTAFENHTAAHWRVNDQTATDQVITKATGTDLSDISIGAMILKDDLATGALTYKTSDAGSLLEPATAQTMIFSPFTVTQKTGDIQTDIEYVYTTSDSPTTGAMTFSASYYPLSVGAVLTPA